jgi:AAA domain
MVFETVTAGAFGSLVDRTLILAPGMTLIYGPNESGKSTWHAALYAGLCGRRRMRGAGTLDDREFAARYRPWSGDAWKVKAVIRLKDGRHVECAHDLEGHIDCSAKDIELGRDYSNEIMDEGSPDGSKWLGLDRRAFLATACISQADDLITSRQLADKIVEIYWPHTVPFAVHPRATVLRQNTTGQAEIVSAIIRFRERHASDPSVPRWQSRLAAPAKYEQLVRLVEWKLIEMPLPRLQIMGQSHRPSSTRSAGTKGSSSAT